MSETKTVTVELGRQTREIVIERISPGHCWFTRTPIVCRFRTGRKIHTEWHPQVCETNGRWFFPAQNIHNRHVAPVAFADAVVATSKWTY